jgi:prepilin-type N-terminal cleavage/methylation domain-containing protein
MLRSRGFTLIEVLVTITIMVILMTLAVVNLRSTQVNARDAERKSDIESIARHLDSLYIRGFPASLNIPRGSYPSTVVMNDATNRNLIFADLPKELLIDPGKTTSSETIFMATNIFTGTDAKNSPATSVLPAPGNDYPYVYQPIADDKTLCDNNPAGEVCRSFNIYTWIEGQEKQSIRIASRHQ